MHAGMYGDTEGDSAVFYGRACSLWIIVLQERSGSTGKSPD